MRNVVLPVGVLLVVATGCVGSGVDVAPDHPASGSAPSAPLAEVAAMLRSDEPAASTAPAAPDPHAHHHHHHGAPADVTGADGSGREMPGEGDGRPSTDGDNGGPTRDGSDAPTEGSGAPTEGSDVPEEGSTPAEADPHAHHHHGGAP